MQNKTKNIPKSGWKKKMDLDVFYKMTVIDNLLLSISDTWPKINPICVSEELDFGIEMVLIASF